MNYAIVTGDRQATHSKWGGTIRQALRDHEIDVVIHGDARGIDTIAKDMAVWDGINAIPFPADWSKHGKAAGPIRNQAMLDYLKFVICEGGDNDTGIVLAFHPDLANSKGTGHMVRIATAAGLNVVVHDGKEKP